MALRGLPFDHGEQLMAIDRRSVAGSKAGVPARVHDLADWRERQRSFDGLAAFARTSVNVSRTEGQPEPVPGARLTDNTFDLLRVRPLLGRRFLSGDVLPGAPPVAILGYDLWQNRFGGDPHIVGQTIRLNNIPTTVVGVMARAFQFPLGESIWLPLRVDPLEVKRGEGQSLGVFGRLKEDVMLDAARREFSALALELAELYPDSNRDTSIVIRSYARRYLADDDNAVTGMYIMMSAVFGVLLIACANVANLLLARTIVHAKELAVRSALGASRLQLMSIVLAESGLIAVAGGVLGVGLAYLGIAWFRDRAVATNPPFWLEFKLDGPVLLFVAGAVVVSALVAGLLPALRASRPNLGDALGDGAKGSSSLRLGRFSRVLVVSELVLSCALLLPTGLMIRSIVNVRTFDHGFRISNVLTARVLLPVTDYADDSKRLQFFDDLTNRLRQNASVQSVALASSLPGQSPGQVRVEVEGADAVADHLRPTTGSVSVTSEYFETLGVRPLAGRVFVDGDTGGSLPVVIVNRRFIERFLPVDRAIGHRIRLIDPGSPQPWLTIVGVVPDLFLGGLRADQRSGVYTPLDQKPRFSMRMVIRTRGEPASITPFVRAQVAALDSSLPVDRALTMGQVLDGETWAVGLFGTLFAAFGVAALLLAAVGLYGVVAFSTSQRTHEIGIRVALGATVGDVVSLVMRQGFSQLGIGVTLGMVLGLGFSRMIASWFFGLGPYDPVTVAIVLVVMLTTTVLACLTPAHRAVRIDPATALRDL